MASSSSNGFKTRSQGRAQRLSVDRRHASEALPCKSFEPIGRHVRIVRVTLQDCRLGRLRGQPHETSRYRGPGLSLLLARGRSCTIVLQTQSKPLPSVWLGCCTSKPSTVGRDSRLSCSFGKSWLLPHDGGLIAEKISLFEILGNSAAKPLIVRTEVRGRFAEQGRYW